jgi:hypothetical protein
VVSGGGLFYQRSGAHETPATIRGQARRDGHRHGRAARRERPVRRGGRRLANVYRRPEQVTSIASTIPQNGDVNPYGVAVVPESSGNLHQGNVLVSNFNDSANSHGVVRETFTGHSLNGPWDMTALDLGGVSELLGTTGWHAAIHSPAANINSDLSPMDGQFHVYRADWTASSITFSFDGTPFHDDRAKPGPGLVIWPGQALLHDPQHCGHQHSRSGQPRWLPVPVEMVVNYVHVWQ